VSFSTTCTRKETRVLRRHLSDAFFRDVFTGGPSNGCVNRTMAGRHMLSLHRIFRDATVSPAGTHLIFEDCNILVMRLSILAQAPLVANRRFLLLSLRWAPAVMDHPYADPPGLDNAVDVLQRPNVIRQRSSFWTYLCPELGCLPLTYTFLDAPTGRRPYLRVDCGFHGACYHCSHAR
jgi:hypothetical protein